MYVQITGRPLLQVANLLKIQESGDQTDRPVNSKSSILQFCKAWKAFLVKQRAFNITIDQVLSQLTTFLSSLHLPLLSSRDKSCYPLLPGLLVMFLLLKIDDDFVSDLLCYLAVQVKCWLYNVLQSLKSLFKDLFHSI